MRRPTGSSRWLVGFLAAIVAVAIGVSLFVALRPSSSPARHGYRDLGTVNGETLWLRPHGSGRVDYETTGSLGGICTGSGPISTTVALCAGTTPHGAALVQFVRVGRRVTSNGPVTMLPYSATYQIAAIFVTDPPSTPLQIKE